MEYSYLHKHTVAGAGSLGYTEPVGAPRPGIANTNRPRGGPFADLVDRILHDSGALDALAFAYTELGAEGRRGMVRAVLQDTPDPGPALGALLAVESDAEMAADLARRLLKLGQSESFATLEERGDGGVACLIHRRFGFAGELMRITWNHNQITRIEIEPRTQLKSAGSSIPSSLSATVETVTPLIWRHIQGGGALPEGSERFAPFFSVA